jgi:hypothetical protein
MGVRVRLATRGSGRWSESSGVNSKFGLSVAEVVNMVGELEVTGDGDKLKLLHCHIGSQIADIQVLKLAAKEVTQVYAELVKRGLGLDLSAVGAALERFTLPGGRGDLLQTGGLTILNDCYNANPQSFRAAMATARSLRGGRRLVFVAGTMRELGSESSALHAQIARELVDLDAELLAAVGEFVDALEPYRARLGPRLVTAADPPALAQMLSDRLEGDEVVVLKASRGVALERILPALTARANSPG